MEQNNPNLPPTTLCRSGCGFYGNDAFDGHCSKCYKDQVKRKQQSSSPVGSAGRSSPASASQGEVDVTGVSRSLSKTNLGTTTLPIQETSGNNSSSLATSSSSTSSPSQSDCSTSSSTTPSLDTATPTIPVPNVDKDSKEEGASGGVETGESSPDPSKDKKKKNRCHTCKKKVGLTGFQCRCGGLYCSLHRYSDKHDCTFNYKEMAQEQIRKNNPVIVGEKIQKI